MQGTSYGYTPVPDLAHEDERMMGASFGARMLFMGLLSVCTHRGRFPGDLRGLACKLRVLELDELGVALGELRRRRVVELYTRDGVEVGRLTRYAYAGLPDNRRYESKKTFSDPYPPPPGVVEPGWEEVAGTPAEVSRKSASSSAVSPPEVAETAPQAVPVKVARPRLVSAAKGSGSFAEGRRQPKSQGSSLQDPERERRATRGETTEGGRRVVTPKAPAPPRAPRAKEVPREQLGLGGTHTPEVEAPAELAEAIATWEARAAELRESGVPVPVVARRDLIALGAEVGAEAFGGGVRLHVREQDLTWWMGPLKCLRLRCGDTWERRRAQSGASSPASSRRAPSRTPSRRDAHGEDYPPPPPPRAFEHEPPASPSVLRETRTPADPTAAGVWSLALEELVGSVGEWDVRQWLRPLDCRQIGPELVLGVPDESHAVWVREQLEQELLRVLGVSVVVYEPYQ